MRAVNGGGPERTAWNSIFVRRLGAWWFGASVAGATTLFIHGCSFDAAPISLKSGQVRGEAIGGAMASADVSQDTTKKKAKGEASLPKDDVDPPAAQGESDTAAAPAAPPKPEANAAADAAPPSSPPAAKPKPATEPMAMAPRVNPEPAPEKMEEMNEPEPAPKPEPPAELPEGRCDLPSCMPLEIRACVGRGECRRDLIDSKRCFDNGIQVEMQRSPFGDIVTVRREDSSTCFSVAMGTDPNTGEVGAAYRNAEGATIAVAGLSGGFWGFRCNSGPGKVFDMRGCGLFGDLPPGVGETALCLPDDTCGKK